MVAFERAPLVERREALFEPVEVDAQRVALAETVRDLCGTQAQAERLVLEVQDAHDAAVRLGFLGRCVPEDVVGAEAVGDPCRGPVSLVLALGRSRPPRPARAPIAPAPVRAQLAMRVAFVVGERVRLHEPGQTELGQDVQRWGAAGEGVRRVPCRDR